MLSLLLVILGTTHASLDCNSVEITYSDGTKEAWPVTGICQAGMRCDWDTSWKYVCIGNDVKHYSYNSGDCSGSANITDPCDDGHRCTYNSVCNKRTCATIEQDYFNGSDSCDGPPGKEFYIANYCYWNYVTFECVDDGIKTSFHNQSIPNCAGKPYNVTTYKNDICYPFDGGVKPNCYPSNSNDSSSAITAGGIVGGILFFIIIICIIFACRRRKRAYNNTKQYQQGLLTPATAQPVEQQKTIATNSNPAIQPQTTYIVTQPQQIGPSGNIYTAPQQPQRVIYAPVQPNMIVNNSMPSQTINQPQPVQQMVPIQQVQSQQVYQQSQNDNIMPSAPPESLPNSKNGPLKKVNNNDEGSNFEANSTISHE